MLDTIIVLSCRMCLFAGIILFVGGFVFFKKYNVSLNCFFFAALSYLIPIIIWFFGSPPSVLVMYGIILLFVLFYTRRTRVMAMIFAIYILLHYVVAFIIFIVGWQPIVPH